MAGLGVAAPPAPAATAPSELVLREFQLSDTRMGLLRDRWLGRLRARYAPGTWAPMRMELTNSDLRLLGLPSKKVLMSRRYSEPTVFDRRGRAQTMDPAVVSFAGTGYFGIRPGAWLLLINEDGVGWCSLAHVYGSPDSYDISTAGHCGKPGDTATVIGLIGNQQPVLLDFGKFAKSTGDGGLGADWALIDISPQYQHLVTPTMAFWGGPRGMYRKEGASVAVKVPRRKAPSVAVDPDPLLAQQIVHYGHGLGVGAGGTPRSGTAIHWGRSHYMFFGAIAPGDSGSGANTLTGDKLGDTREAAGIMTHLWIDSEMRNGLGIMGGTRATVVDGTLADGQLVGYPAPLQMLP